MTTSSPGKKQPIPFGKYLLLDRVNIGGMAEVWRGKTSGAVGFDRLVAIKRILPNIAEDEEFITMFIDEAKITVQLTHANLAQIYELGNISSSYFIAMEYIPGKDLRAIFDRCRKKGEPAPVELLCYVFAKVCEGLDYAHRKKDALGREMNIVHRDVSPQNLLISYEGEVKVIDFGIAKAAGKASKTQAGILKGKFGYMSPEQIRGVPIDRRSDIFSLGVCLYELLTGERLFVGDSDFSVLEKVRKAEVLPPSTYNGRVPEELEKIVFKALARDPDERYQYASEVGDDLQKFLLGLPTMFSRKDLVQYMKAAFAEEVERENQRLQEYQDVLPPEPSGAPPPDPLLSSVREEPAAPEVARTAISPPTPPQVSVVAGAPAEPVVSPVMVPRPSSVAPTQDKTLTGEDDRQVTTIDNREEISDLTDPTLNDLALAPAPTQLARRLVADVATSPEVASSPSPSTPSVPETEVRAPRLERAPSRPPLPMRELGSPGRLSIDRRTLPFLGGGAALFLVLLVAILHHYRAPPTGLLLLEVPPELRGKARVNVNGEELRDPDGRPPREWPLLHRTAAGKSTVMVTAPGYEPFTQTLVIREGQEVTTLRAKLVSSGELVDLRVLTEPPGAEVRINGGLPESLDPISLRAGAEYVVDVRAPGFRPYTTRVIAKQGSGPLSISAKLDPVEFLLFLNSQPSGATILIGGREMGRTPNSVRVGAGVTAVVLRKRCYETLVLPLQLPPEPRAPIPVAGTLRKQAGCR